MFQKIKIFKFLLSFLICFEVYFFVFSDFVNFIQKNPQTFLKKYFPQKNFAKIFFLGIIGVYFNKKL